MLGRSLQPGRQECTAHLAHLGHLLLIVSVIYLK
eukprot:XP_001707391.1 Hypothetical protein GL50803_23789 [Giardia lamblia ATCC 50803]